MNDTELKELNDFVGANLIRNSFLPLLHKLTSLPNSNVEIEEYHTGEDEADTSSIRYTFLPKNIPPKGDDYDDEYDNPLRIASVRYDWTIKDGVTVTIPDKVIFEFSWGGECYSLLYTVEEALMAIDGLYNSTGFYNEIKALRKLRAAEWDAKQNKL